MAGHARKHEEDGGQAGAAIAAVERIEVGPLQADDEAYLDEVVAVVARAVGGSAAVSITVGHPRDGAVVGSTSRFAQQADDLQQRAGDGPCRQAWDSGAVVGVADVSGDERWPSLAELAAGSPLSSILAIPVEVGGRVAGVVNLYSAERDAFGGVDVTRRELVECAVSAALARVAERRSLAGQVVNLERALMSRATIDQAKGILMAQRRVDAEAAFRILQRTSQHENVPVRELAAGLVEDAAHRRVAGPA
jgi:GAF domain-containing protein